MVVLFINLPTDIFKHVLLLYFTVHDIFHLCTSIELYLPSYHEILKARLRYTILPTGYIWNNGLNCTMAS